MRLRNPGRKSLDQENPSVNCVREALRAMMENVASNELSFGNLASNKRQINLSWMQQAMLG